MRLFFFTSAVYERSEPLASVLSRAFAIRHLAICASISVNRNEVPR